MKIELISSGNGVWHVEYLQDGLKSRAYCGKQIRNPIATNLTIPSREAVCKPCARMAVDLNKSKDSNEEGNEDYD